MFLKPFNKLAGRVLSGFKATWLRLLALYPDKTLTLSFIKHYLMTPTQSGLNVIMELFAIGTFKCVSTGPNVTKKESNPSEGSDPQIILIV